MPTAPLDGVPLRVAGQAVTRFHGPGALELRCGHDQTRRPSCHVAGYHARMVASFQKQADVKGCEAAARRAMDRWC